MTYKPLTFQEWVERHNLKDLYDSSTMGTMAAAWNTAIAAERNRWLAVIREVEDGADRSIVRTVAASIRIRGGQP